MKCESDVQNLKKGNKSPSVAERANHHHTMLDILGGEECEGSGFMHWVGSCSHTHIPRRALPSHLFRHFCCRTGWQVSANRGLSRFKPSWQKQVLPVFTKHGTTTAALRLC